MGQECDCPAQVNYFQTIPLQRKQVWPCQTPQAARHQYLRILASLVNRAPNLFMSVRKTISQDWQEQLKINPQGLVGSLRNRKDGQVYFGDTQQQTDYVIPNSFKKNLFKISFDPDSKKYSIQDFGVSKGLFLRKRVIVLYDGLLFKIGKILALVRKEQDCFQISFHSDPVDGRILKVTQSGITIGRDPNCTVTINDQRVSKVHCQVIHKIEWAIVDKSRNGLWAYVNQPVSLQSGMQLESQALRFKVQII